MKSVIRHNPLFFDESSIAQSQDNIHCKLSCFLRFAYEIQYLFQTEKKNYLPIETIAKFCRWKIISRKHGGGRIKKVIRELAKLGLIDLHGKGIVASLTSDGVLVARDYLQI